MTYEEAADRLKEMKPGAEFTKVEIAAYARKETKRINNHKLLKNKRILGLSAIAATYLGIFIFALPFILTYYLGIIKASDTEWYNIFRDCCFVIGFLMFIFGLGCGFYMVGWYGEKKSSNEKKYISYVEAAFKDIRGYGYERIEKHRVIDIINKLAIFRDQDNKRSEILDYIYKYDGNWKYFEFDYHLSSPEDRIIWTGGCLTVPIDWTPNINLFFVDSSGNSDIIIPTTWNKLETEDINFNKLLTTYYDELPGSDISTILYWLTPQVMEVLIKLENEITDYFGRAASFLISNSELYILISYLDLFKVRRGKICNLEDDLHELDALASTAKCLKKVWSNLKADAD